MTRRSMFFIIFKYGETNDGETNDYLAEKIKFCILISQEIFPRNIKKATKTIYT